MGDDNMEVHDLMYRNHCLLEKFLKDLEIDLGMDKFNKFKWELEKHFFMEEKAIFQSIDDAKAAAMVADVNKQHIQIMKLLDEIEINMAIEGNEADLSKLKKLLITHKDYEDQTLYPKLDEVLSDDQKSKIIERIKELYPELC